MKTLKASLIGITICCLFIAQNLFSQPPEIDWQHTIGGSVDDRLYAIQQTSDGGYILGGYSFSGISADKTEASMSADYWVVKLNSAGDIEWQNTIGGDDYDFLKAVQQTTDGGYLLGGDSYSGISGDKTEANVSEGSSSDYWVVKLNTTGGIEWQNTIGGKNDEFLSAIQQTTDGGYVVGGSSRSNISADKSEVSVGSYDYWVVKLNTSGSIKWENTIGGNKLDNLTSMQQTSDGGYFLGGYSKSGISGDKTEAKFGGYDYWVVKINTEGNVEWENTIGGKERDELNALQQTSDGGYILGGTSDSDMSLDKTEKSLGELDYWVIKLDNDGSIQWQNTIGGSGYDYLNSLQQTSDGGFILGGVSTSGISGDKTEALSGFADIWVIKLNAIGSIEWQNAIGGTGNDHLSSLQQTSDIGYILGGSSDSGISGDKTEESKGGEDYWVVKLFPFVCNGWIVYADADNDGYGDTTNSLFSADCLTPNGYVTNNTDCNDVDATINPSHTEVCGNAIDDNCNGQTDEDCFCVIPANLLTEDITASTAQLRWDIVSNAISYKVRYKVKNTDTWTITKAEAYNYTKYVTGLFANTEYTWQVKSRCGTYPISFSDWSTKEFFTTSPLKMGTSSVPTTAMEIYPNPTSTEATIYFSLSHSSFVAVKIFDVNNKEMGTAVNQTLNAGEHFFSINTVEFPKGIYIVQLIFENEIQNQKLIIQ